MSLRTFRQTKRHYSPRRRVQLNRQFGYDASFESLEPRILLAALPLADVAKSLAGRINSTTIITHGFQVHGLDTGDTSSDGDALISLAEAVLRRVNDSSDNPRSVNDPRALLIDYDILTSGGQGIVDADHSILPDPETNTKGDLVLLYDWAVESNEWSPGWTTAAGDALVNLLIQIGAVDLETGARDPNLHFIAHSFGSAVTSEAVERLARLNVHVDHVTYLDPHDFDQTLIPVDERQRQFAVGLPQLAHADTGAFGSNYGATIWENVAYADVYYQTDDGPNIPMGRPLSGAYNERLTNLPGPIRHTNVWEWYRDTVNPPASQGSGYNLSRIANRDSGDTELQRIRQEHSPNFFSSQQDHQFSAPTLLTSSAHKKGVVENIKWPAQWNPLTIENGDFESPGDECLSAPGTPELVPTDNIVPGWSHHGGGGNAHIHGHGCAEGNGTNYRLVLNANGTQRTHNWLYVPEEASTLVFDYTVTTSSQDVFLQVSFGNTIIKRVPLTHQDPRQPVVALIPDFLRGQSTTLRLELASLNAINGVVEVDNFRFERGGYTGDVVPVDVAAAIPVDPEVFLDQPGFLKDDSYFIEGFETVDSAGRATPLKVTTNKRGDLEIEEGRGGYVIFSDRTNPSSFFWGRSGLFYLAPGLADDLPNDSATDQPGFQGILNAVVRVNGTNRRIPIRVDSGYSTDGRSVIRNDSTMLDAMRIQQRLRYLGFPDSGGNPLVVDGIVGPLTSHAIALFKDP